MIAAKKYPSYLLEELFVISKMLATFVVGYYLFRSNNSQTTRCQKTWGQGNVEICLKRRRNDYTVFVKSYGYLYSTYILYLHMCMCMNLHMHTVEAQKCSLLLGSYKRTREGPCLPSSFMFIFCCYCKSCVVVVMLQGDPTAGHRHGGEVKIYCRAPVNGGEVEMRWRADNG